MDLPGASFPVIALVCSAGGLNALTAVLSSLPADLPAAMIVLQHTDPLHPNGLDALLQRRTDLEVELAHDGDQLTAGRVLIAPSGQHTLITATGTIALIPSGDRPPYRPSADLLLTTLATAVGHRACAVVLTGYGNDAATGATAIHHFGGTVIATTAETSTHPSMPQATTDRDHVTDHTIALEDVAALLIALATTPVLPGTDTVPPQN